MPSKSAGRERPEIMAAISELNGKVDLLLQRQTNSRSVPKACALTVMTDHLIEDIDVDLERNMVSPCDCRSTCKDAFTDFLQRSAKLLGEEFVEERKLMEMRKELDQMRSKAPYKKCSQCFDEVNEMFNHHVRMVRSQNSYVSEDNLHGLISKMDEEAVVRDVIDPLSNPQRLEIMKLMLDQPASYSLLSRESGLKGGNLLFHLQKLLSAGMIEQNQERGDYSLSEKGGKVLRYLTLMTLEIGSAEWV
jgi:DNA-binding transcriptional ArsR family regulator